MTNSGDRLFDGVPDRRKDVELRALIDAAESAYARMRDLREPDAVYWQAHLKQKLFELRKELAETEAA